MAKTDRSLTEAEEADVRKHMRNGCGLVGGDSPALPDEWQQRLYEAINAFRSEPSEVREGRLSETALCFGYMWGQAVCYGLGWEWAAVSLEPESEVCGVVTPNRSHVVFPLQYMQKILSDPEHDQTSLLLYNMLKANSLPPGGPGEYCVLG